MIELDRLIALLLVVLAVAGIAVIKTNSRQRQFERGRKLSRESKYGRKGEGLRWGSCWIPENAATQHFLAVGTTGSGKSLVQRLLMKSALLEIKPGADKRALILDAKNDTVSFLDRIGSTCPVYTLNPFDGRSGRPIPVAWDIAADITSASRALNLAAALIPAEKSGSNRYFTDAARMVVSGVIESLIAHSPGKWTFADLVLTTLSLETTKRVLSRDENGKAVIANFLADDRTAYQVFTTVVSRMAYYRSIAGLWQHFVERLSLREWLSDESVLLLGVDATARTALDAINEIVFRVLVEEIDAQQDSETRRTWVWIDEARLSGPLLRGEMLPYLAVKGRSRGACLVLAFQDIEGFREAAGVKIAHELIAQCSHKALLRLETDESAAWGAKLLGQYEVLEHMRSTPANLLSSGSKTEQLSRRDAVLASEFYTIPPTNRRNGLTGYFVSPEFGVLRGWISPDDVAEIVSSSGSGQFIARGEGDQALSAWSDNDLLRLGLVMEADSSAKPSLRLKKRQGMAGKRDRESGYQVF